MKFTPWSLARAIVLAVLGFVIHAGLLAALPLEQTPYLCLWGFQPVLAYAAWTAWQGARHGMLPVWLPAPWLACELGWFVAEYGRQPWTIYGVLPTHMSVSTLTVESLYGSLFGFVGFYTVLLVVEMYLMVKFARLGPGSLGTGRYLSDSAHAHA